jgi:uncharacterized membrane protein
MTTRLGTALLINNMADREERNSMAMRTAIEERDRDRVLLAKTTGTVMMITQMRVFLTLVHVPLAVARKVGHIQTHVLNLQKAQETAGNQTQNLLVQKTVWIGMIRILTNLLLLTRLDLVTHVPDIVALAQEVIHDPVHHLLATREQGLAFSPTP